MEFPTWVYLEDGKGQVATDAADAERLAKLGYTYDTPYTRLKAEQATEETDAPKKKGGRPKTSDA